MFICIVMAILAVVSCIRIWGPSQSAAITSVWLWILIYIAYNDIKSMQIPDKYTIALGLSGAVSFLIIPDAALDDRLIGMCIISIPMLVTDFLIPAGFGGGDIKLMAAAGLFLGWKRTLLAFMAGALGAGVYSLFLLLTKRAGMKDCFAFGPFLCGGLSAAALLGDRVTF